MDSDIIQVTTTCDDRAKLDELARHLVQKQFAACCQIEGPITSHYRWQGNVESAIEYRCLIKTIAGRFGEVERTILSLHPYDQPQITAVKASNVESGFAAWVRTECGG